MYHWLGWVFIVAGVVFISLEVVVSLKKRFRSTRDALPNDIVIELIKKLPWIVVLGLILLYLGLYIVGVPVPFSLAIGNPTN
jgi:drug/metabolite transporter (DMT)-like permease